MFHYVSLAFVAVVLAIMLAGEVQARTRKTTTVGGPQVDALVVKTVNHRGEPADHDLCVSYLHERIEHRSVAQNSFSVGTVDKGLGDKVRVRVNPRSPDICLLIRPEDCSSD
jgi:hypothetical protein